MPRCWSSAVRVTPSSGLAGRSEAERDIGHLAPAVARTRAHGDAVLGKLSGVLVGRAGGGGQDLAHAMPFGPGLVTFVACDVLPGTLVILPVVITAVPVVGKLFFSCGDLRCVISLACTPPWPHSADSTLATACGMRPADIRLRSCARWGVAVRLADGRKLYWCAPPSSLSLKRPSCRGLPGSSNLSHARARKSHPRSCR
jgi:hypothetical protein